MSQNHNPPRQDRRTGRAVVRAHNNEASVGHDQGQPHATISDPENGKSVGRGDASPEGASAPGALGPPVSDEASSW